MDNTNSNLNDNYSDEPRQTGYVKWFDEAKGYGFIRREDGGDIFVHFSNINHEPQIIKENERVEFTVVSTEKGPQAYDVIVLAEAL